MCWTRINTESLLLEHVGETRVVSKKRECGARAPLPRKHRLSSVYSLEVSECLYGICRRLIETFELTFDLTGLTLLPSGHGSSSVPVRRRRSDDRLLAELDHWDTTRPACGDTRMTRTWRFSAGRELATCGRGCVCFCFCFSTPARDEHALILSPFQRLSDISTATGLLNISLLGNKNKALLCQYVYSPAALPSEQFSMGLQLNSHMKQRSGLCGATPPGTPLVRDVTPHASNYARASKQMQKKNVV